MQPSTNTEFPLGLVQEFQSEYPGIKMILPTDATWSETCKYFINQAIKPGVIARPQNATHVQELVRFCVSNNVEFVVRSGGHDVAGRSNINGALVIDMRDIQHVDISKDAETATIGGGTLIRDLTTALGEQELVTPTGPLASVGYVGWATLGGYGLLSEKYGLGVDQLIGAQYVNAAGDIVEATDEALTGIRGGGGSFGIITEVTIKVYRLKEILKGTFILESSDKGSAWAAFVKGYKLLLGTGAIPKSLSLQPTAVAIPGLGNAFLVTAIWAGPDHDQGHKWMDKITTLGTCVKNGVEVTTWDAYCKEHEKTIGFNMYGRARTLNFRQLTAKTTNILAKHHALIPGPGSLFSILPLRNLGQLEKSVFETRCDHYWLEIVAISRDPDAAIKADEWALALKQDLLKNDTENILDSAYIGFLDNDELQLDKVYGNRYETLVSIKKKLDPKNVFTNSVPKLGI